MKSTLDKLAIGTSCTAIKVNGSDKIKNRFLDVGLTDDTKIECLFYGPRREINAYLIKGAIIAIRKEDAENIVININ